MSRTAIVIGIVLYLLFTFLFIWNTARGKVEVWNRSQGKANAAQFTASVVGRQDLREMRMRVRQVGERVR